MEAPVNLTSVLATRYVVLLALLLTVACGAGGREGRGAGPGGEKGGSSFDVAACEAQLGDLLTALQEIDSRLDIGLNIQEYGDRVGDAKVAYDRLQPGQLERGCLERVGVPLEEALQAYIDAYRSWDRCIDRFECELDEIEPELQQRWARASAKIEEATSALEG